MELDPIVLHTFYVVDIINNYKYANLKVAPIANPAMPSPVPMPNIIGMLPGMTALGTMMMKSMMGKINWPSVPELLEICLEMDVKMVACTPTLEMTGLTKDDLIEGVKVGGAADYLDFGLDANINLFV